MGLPNSESIDCGREATVALFQKKIKKIKRSHIGNNNLHKEG